MSKLGAVFQHLSEAGDLDDLEYGPNNSYVTSTEFTQAKVTSLANTAAQTFISANKNLFAAYQLDGPDGLISTVGEYVKYKSVCQKEINDAIESKSEQNVLFAFRKAFSLAFVELAEKNALDRILLVDKYDTAGMQEYARMRALAKPPQSTQARPAAPTKSGVEPEKSALDQCVADWRELRTEVFRAKWMGNPQLARVVEQMFATGRA
jgi:hypothetical protein